MINKFNSDVDIDFGNREDALQHLRHIPASMFKEGVQTKHASGIYVTDIPINPYTGSASLDYSSAEERGYVKLDFLNVSLYTYIKDELHLEELMNQVPDWASLYDPTICAKIIHINNHYQTLIQMPEAVTSITRLAMFLAVIRPAKKHLIGSTWAEISKTIWDPDPTGNYAFKKSHAISYAHLVIVHMNLITNGIL